MGFVGRTAGHSFSNRARNEDIFETNAGFAEEKF
jgi:hypothetical protein